MEQIYTTHNYIDFSMKMMRKGAVAAPEGRKLVIPFNMRDGLIIARGKGNEDWNQSAPHGAGRLLSRSDAKELIDLDEYREAMKGIYSTSVGTGTIDESPMAYKDPKEILRLIEDTVEGEYFIRPVINLKATNSYDSSVEIDVKEEAPEEMEMHQQAMGETYVDTMTLHTSTFNKQIVCNGRLRAKAMSELNFVTQGVTAEIYVREGSVVSKGTLIASLDKRERLRELERAEN